MAEPQQIDEDGKVSKEYAAWIEKYNRLLQRIKDHPIIMRIEANRAEDAIKEIARYHLEGTKILYIDAWLNGGKKVGQQVNSGVSTGDDFDPLDHVGAGDNITNIIYTEAIHRAIQHDEPELFAALMEHVEIPNTRAAVSDFFEMTNFLPGKAHGDSRRRPEIFKVLINMPDLAQHLDPEVGRKIYTALSQNREEYKAEQAKLREILGLKEEKINWDEELPKIVWKGRISVHQPEKLGSIEEVEEIIGSCSQEAIKAALEALIAKKPDEKVSGDERAQNREAFFAMVDYLLGKLDEPRSVNIIKASVYGDEAVFKHLFEKLEVDADVGRLSELLLSITASKASPELKQFVLDAARILTRGTILGMAVNTVRMQDEEFLGSADTGLINLILGSEHANLITGGGFEVGGDEDLLFIAARPGRGSTEDATVISNSIGLVYRLAAAGADITATDASGNDAVSVLKNRISSNAPQLRGDHRFQKLEVTHEAQLAARIERARTEAKVDVLIESMPRIAEAQTGALVARIAALSAAAKEAGIDPSLIFSQPGILALPDPNGAAAEAQRVQSGQPGPAGALELKPVQGKVVPGE